jgi:hypothetical protein
MSATMLRIADFLPLTYAVNALQDAWNARGWDRQAYAVLGAITLVAGWLSLRLYNWD